MKKKLLSFVAIIAISFSLFHGCNKDEENTLIINGEEVVLKIGDSYIKANEIFFDMLSGQQNAEKIYEDVERFVIEKSSVADQSILNNAKYEVDKVEARAQNLSELNEISYKEALNDILEAYGVNNIEEYEEKMIFDLRKERTISNYIKDNKELFFQDYINEFAPFHVSHILVELSETNVLDETQKTLTEEEGEKIVDIFSRLVNGEKFYNIAILSDDDDTKDNGGDLGIIDLNSDIEDEIKYSLMMYALNKYDKDTNITVPSFIDNFYGEGLEGIPATYIDVLDENISNTTTQVRYYPSGASISTTPSRARNVIFNTLLNSKSGRVMINDYANAYEFDNANEIDNILYPTSEEVGYSEAGSEFVVVNGSDHPFIVVRSERGLHFLSIHMTPFEEKANEYYNPYFEGEKEIESYFEIPSLSSQRNERKDLLEEKYEDFINLSLYNNNEVEENINYMYVLKYFEENNAEFTNQRMEDLFFGYIENKINLEKNSFYDKHSDNLKEFSSRVSLIHDPLFERQFIPLACIGNRSDCEYTFESGFVYTNPGGEE